MTQPSPLPSPLGSCSEETRSLLDMMKLGRKRGVKNKIYILKITLTYIHHFNVTCRSKKKCLNMNLSHHELKHGH